MSVCECGGNVSVCVCVCVCGGGVASLPKLTKLFKFVWKMILCLILPHLKNNYKAECSSWPTIPDTLDTDTADAGARWLQNAVFRLSYSSCKQTNVQADILSFHCQNKLAISRSQRVKLSINPMTRESSTDDGRRAANQRVRHKRRTTRLPEPSEKWLADESWQSTQRRAGGGGSLRCWNGLLCVQSLWSLPVQHVGWRAREVFGCVVGGQLSVLILWLDSSQNYTDWRSSWRRVCRVVYVFPVASEWSLSLSIESGTQQLKSSRSSDEIYSTRAHAYLEIHQTEISISQHQI